MNIFATLCVIGIVLTIFQYFQTRLVLKDPVKYTVTPITLFTEQEQRAMLRTAFGYRVFMLDLQGTTFRTVCTLAWLALYCYLAYVCVQTEEYLKVAVFLLAFATVMFQWSVQRRHRDMVVACNFTFVKFVGVLIGVPFGLMIALYRRVFKSQK